MALHARPTRRRFAASVAAVLRTGLAGCTGDALEDAYSSPPEGTPISRDCERDHHHARDLTISNRDSSPHTVTLVITGVGEDGVSDPVYEAAFVLQPEQRVYLGVVFDPGEEDIERYDDYVATATSEDGRSDSRSIYETVVRHPLRYDLTVRFERDGTLVVVQMHSDTSGAWTPAC